MCKKSKKLLKRFPQSSPGNRVSLKQEQLSLIGFTRAAGPSSYDTLSSDGGNGGGGITFLISHKNLLGFLLIHSS